MSILMCWECKVTEDSATKSGTRLNLLWNILVMTSKLPKKKRFLSFIDTSKLICYVLTNNEVTTQYFDSIDRNKRVPLWVFIHIFHCFIVVEYLDGDSSLVSENFDLQFLPIVIRMPQLFCSVAEFFNCNVHR